MNIRRTQGEGWTTVKTGETVGGEITDRDIRAFRLVRYIISMVLMCFSVVVFLDVLSEHPTHFRELGCGLCLVPVLALQPAHSSPAAGRWSTCCSRLSLGLQALLVFLPLLVVGQEWGALAGLLVGSLLILVRGMVVWVLLATVALGVALPGLLFGLGVVDTANLMVYMGVIGLTVVVYGLSRLSGLVSEVMAAYEDAARLVVVKERMRFARDLHDTLGLSLSSITLKSELMRHRVGTQSEAHAELDEILELSRRALSDVRAVAGGYRPTSLADEADSVRAVLTAAGIDTSVELLSLPDSPQADGILAIVLREAVTNVLRHSKATRCSIRASRIGGAFRLSVFNDGAHPATSQSGPDDGSGLASLAFRLTAVEGRLRARAYEGGGFRLLAEVPACSNPVGRSRPVTLRDPLEQRADMSLPPRNLCRPGSGKRTGGCFR
jgi:two-component system sensor histidine kinase DesK